jgi:RNA polymerase sigma-70 factor (ECF subfamily)
MLYLHPKLFIAQDMQNLNQKSVLIADYYSEHYDELKAFVAKRILYADEAEDIVQNVFMRLLTSDKMITPITMPSLVYTIARNLVFDYWRHRRSVEEYEHYMVYAGMCDSLDVQSVYSATEVNELLERGIARLNGKQRDIYRMNLSEGLQVSEISERTGISYKSVEHRLGAARKEIRHYMKRMLA